MNEKHHRTQYLICTSAGFTCLGLSLLTYQAEGTFVAHGWIHERTTGAFVLLFMAVLMLFLGSRAYSTMLFARLSPGATQQPAEPVRAGGVIALTMLVTLAVFSVVELQSLGMEDGWDFPDIIQLESRNLTLFGLPIALGVGAVGVVSIGPFGVGVISFGGFGVIAVQGIGIVSVGGAGLGVIALGGAACGVIAIGGAAVGYVAIGGGAVGVYVLGASGAGRYVLSKRRQDAEAVALFSKWVPGVRKAYTAAQAARAAGDRGPGKGDDDEFE
jgi:hypothetical protein